MMKGEEKIDDRKNLWVIFSEGKATGTRMIDIMKNIDYFHKLV